MSWRALAGAAGVLTAALLGCTVDQLVGLSQDLDAGPEICADSCTCPAGQSCDFVCGAQTCTSGCQNMSDCSRFSDGGSYGFRCEAHPPCAPACTAGPCAITCDYGNENVNCQVTCNPTDTCVVSCRGGGCTVVCGSVHPATACGDGGVYSCSTCP